MIATWFILVPYGVVYGAVFLGAAVMWVAGKIRYRRAERAWAEGVARKVVWRHAEIAWLEHVYAMDSAEERS